METFKAMFDGKEREFGVRSATSKDIKEANKIRSIAYWKAVKDGLPMANDAIKMSQKTSWTPEKAQEFRDLQKELAECEEILSKKRDLKLGGPSDKDPNTMFRVALKCFDLRNKVSELNMAFADAQQNTVEGYSENERLNYIVYATTVYKDSGERVFPSYDDFDNSTVLSEENSEKYMIATLAFAAYQSKLLEGYQKSVDSNPENTFLKRFKFINQNGEFIDKEGKLIDSNGGSVTTEEPKLVEPKPFLDNDGKPIEDEEYKKELEEYKASLAKIKTVQEPEKAKE